MPEDDIPMGGSALPTRSDLTSEALTLLLEGSIPRLVLLLVALGHGGMARQLLAFQSSVVGILTSPPKKPRKSLA